MECWRVAGFIPLSGYPMGATPDRGAAVVLHARATPGIALDVRPPSGGVPDALSGRAPLYAFAAARSGSGVVGVVDAGGSEPGRISD